MAIGYWDQTWSGPNEAPAGATLGCAFSGEVDTSRALAVSQSVYASLIGKKYITIGGGNVAGRWSKASINTLVSIINAGQLSNYQGLALDVEECYEVGLASSFLAATAAAKARGM